MLSRNIDIADDFLHAVAASNTKKGRPMNLIGRPGHYTINLTSR